MKDLYFESYKIAMKEKEDDTADRKIHCAYGLEELVLLKWSHHPRQCSDSMQSLSKYQSHVFTEVLQIVLKFV